MMPAARLPRKLQQQLIDAALSQPAREVCGLLGGDNDAFLSFYPVANIADDKLSSFLMDPQGQVTAMRQMREKGECLLGIFHSHPASPARPSERDKEQAAYLDVYYLIVSLQTARPDLGVFYFDGTEFTKVSVTTPE